MSLESAAPASVLRPPNSWGRALAVAVVLASCARAPIEAAEAIPVRTENTVRVLSFNTWGIPFRDERDALQAALAPAIATFEPDVVCLQEVWHESDAIALGEALAELGLAHEVHRASDAFLAYNSSGLLIASRYPILDDDFLIYESGRTPTVPWHADWYAGKGLLRAVIDAPMGQITVANTHLQADYRPSLYEEARMGQVAELIAQVSHDPPDVLAGDFNATRTSLEMRLLRGRLSLQTRESARIDAVLASDRWVSENRAVLPAPTTEVEGVQMAVSDHPVVLADLRLVTSPAPRQDDLSDALDTGLSEWISEERPRVRFLGWLCVLLAIGALAAMRRRKLVGLASIPLLLLAYRWLVLDAARDEWVERVATLLLDHAV